MSSYRMKYKIGATQYHIPVVDDMAGFGGGVPLGTILPYSANSQYPPEGFLWCDGSAVSREMYPDLFSLIGTTFGNGDGSTTFNLPDLTLGEFLEGSNTAGTEHEAGLPNIAGTFNSRSVNNDATATGPFTRSNNQWAAGSSTSYEGPMNVSFDASKANPIYGNSETVQPKSVTVRYIIKAFNATTSSSELIDITQYASALNQKPSKSLNDLTQAGEDHFYENDFTIIYPNNGTESNPANISVNNRYVEQNPFPGYEVYCVVEVFYNNTWGESRWHGGSSAFGVEAFFYEGNIVIQTGAGYLVVYPSVCWNNCFGNGNGDPQPTTAPARVKVWKVGKLPTQSP